MFLGKRQRLFQLQNTQLTAFIINDPNLAGRDGFIDIRFFSYDLTPLTKLNLRELDIQKGPVRA
jgi:hypothetical protein